MVVRAAVGQAAVKPGQNEARVRFTGREVELAGWLAADCSLTAIGERIGISEATVRVHLASIRAKVELALPDISLYATEPPPSDDAPEECIHATGALAPRLVAADRHSAGIPPSRRYDPSIVFDIRNGHTRNKVSDMPACSRASRRYGRPTVSGDPQVVWQRIATSHCSAVTGRPSPGATIGSLGTEVIAMTEATLYERLGGAFAIAAVIDHFSDALIANPIVGESSSNPKLRAWHTKSLDRLPGLKFMRTLWVCDVAGGPFHFTATRPGTTPLGLEEAHRELQIASSEFDEVAAELTRTLELFKVPEREQAEVLAAFAAHKPEVTEGALTAARDGAAGAG